MPYAKSLFIFRRDFRLHDNTGLLHALENSKTVIPCFILTPEQLEKNPYKSEHCVAFMLASLRDLEKQLQERGGKLYYFRGKPTEVVAECIRKLKVEAVFVNRDYTPYALARDAQIAKVCEQNGGVFEAFDDALLHPPESALKSDGKPYTVFTPFFRKASKLRVDAPKPNRHTNYFRGSIAFATKPPKAPSVEAGRTAALALLKALPKLTRYTAERDVPALNATSHLSPHLKFTTCSPREAFAAAPKDVRRELYWRDFFTSIAFFFPHVFGGAFHKKYDKVRWSYDRRAFKAWCEGQTGFPLVDAGMRELAATGFMHNRIRMVTASFLVKDLHIDWRWGEKYFARNLTDYDPAVNNGNWQWVASTGCDAQPYFRVFNPWSQQEKFDPECVYIKKWVAEVREWTADEIHGWREAKRGRDGYPAPMVEHGREAKRAIRAYKMLRPQISPRS